MQKISGIANNIKEALKLRILFDSKKCEFKKPFGAVRTGEKCEINIKIPCTCCAEKVYIKLKNEHTDSIYNVEMIKKTSRDDYDIFGAEFSLDECGLYFYYFYIKATENSFSLFKYGFDDTNIEDGKKWQLSCYEKEFDVPQDFCGTVMYQIFPDRFYRDEILPCKDKLEPYKIKTNTKEVPDFLPDENGEILNLDFYGGNLKGITKKLTYLKELGVGLIYLNPIFMAYSNHRYDTCDYKRIDPLLGNEEDFKSLCDTAHSLGIKIILDGVFSHTGSNSIYFDSKHIFGNGAVSNENSPYRQWFNFSKYPDEYDSWWGIKTLPCVNELSESYLDYIIRGEDSVIKKWLSLGADGFRLDVADELPDEFIKIFRDEMKKIKNDSFLLGEVWEDASNKISYGKRRKYFTHTELDSVMNYVFKDAIISFVTEKISCKEFVQRIWDICENYPSCALKSAMNHLSSHDTERIITALAPVCKDMSREEKAEYTLSEGERAISFGRFFVAVMLQFMLPGNPCIYYGDEIGMEGFGDPFCRGYFNWEKEKGAIFQLYKAFAKIKRTYECVRDGEIEFRRWNNVLCFDRIKQSRGVRVCLNMGLEPVKAEKEKMIFSHNISNIGGEIYINNKGFVLYEFGR